MVYFNLIVKGLYAGFAYLLLVIIGEMLLPGTFKDTAFSFLGIVSFFILFMISMVFDYAPVD